MTLIPGIMRKVVSGATASTSVALPLNDMRVGRHVLVFHKISEGGSGYCSVSLSPDGGTTVMNHHGNSRGFPVQDVTTNYSAIAYDCAGQVVLNLHVAAGTHDVWVQVTD
ncbi:MAG TPA: hypothetical protein VHV83_12725 [Armatimonadota bacterium]|nr:hypothetical protein [Armatimonadota bacterium]